MKFDKLIESILKEYTGAMGVQSGAMGAASAPGTDGGNETGGTLGTYPQDGYGGESDARIPTGLVAISRDGKIKEFDDEDSLLAFLNDNDGWKKKINEAVSMTRYDISNLPDKNYKILIDYLDENKLKAGRDYDIYSTDFMMISYNIDTAELQQLFKKVDITEA